MAETPARARTQFTIVKFLQGFQPFARRYS